MQTLYIDIYFLINFTVNLLSLYFAALFSKVQSTAVRLITASAASAFFACFYVLVDVPDALIIALIALVSMSVSFIFAKGVSFLRRVKLNVSFLMFETFIGGLVGWLYGVLDKYLYPYISSEQTVYNNKLILLSILVLFSYGIIKMLFIIFSSSATEKNKKFTVCLLGELEEFTALVDSGNLLRDPMSGSPVILIKRESSVIFSKYKDALSTDDDEIKKRIRLIPAKGLGSEKILLGIRCDYLMLEKSKNKYENAVIALDDEEGSYGGYTALMPASVCLDEF